MQAIAIFVVLAVLIAGALYFWNRRSQSPYTPSEKKLILTTENLGFDGLTTSIPKFPPNRFTSVVLVWLDTSKTTSDLATFIKAGKALVRENNPGFDTFEYWIQLTVKPDKDWPVSTTCCGPSSCTSICAAPRPQAPSLCNDSCTSAYNAEVIQANKILKSLGETQVISGLHFDNEGVGTNSAGVSNLPMIVTAMQAVSKMYTPNLSLSFTKGISNCTGRPRILDVPFDYCMGQTYTDCSADMFTSVPCGEIDLDVAFDDHSWSKPGIVTGGYSTPLFCIGGCGTTDMSRAACASGGPVISLNETISTDGLAKVMAYMSTTDMIKKFPNFGLYNGTIPQPKAPCRP